MQTLTPEELQYLADQYLKGSISAEDRTRLDAWYLSMPENIEWNDPENQDALSLRNTMYTDILQRIVVAETIPVVPLWKRAGRIAVAAAVLLILATGIYVWMKPSEKNSPVIAETNQKDFFQDVPPGGNKAILTLADGVQILLDSIADGLVAQQGTTLVNKQKAVLDYSKVVAGIIAGSRLNYNTVSTPRGGKFSVILPDGTEVWLNAASTLRFPTTFSDTERKVEITGEAYFEVTHNAEKPFLVYAAGQRVQVLGTVFNINAYGDEPVMKTTLLSGSVRLSSSDNKTATFNTILKPGQQAVFAHSGQTISRMIGIETCDTEETIAWKNDNFSFNEADIQTVMRQLARWYDLDIIYEGKIPALRFGGTFSKSNTLSEVLKILQLSNVNYTIKGKQIIIHK